MEEQAVANTQILERKGKWEGKRVRRKGIKGEEKKDGKRKGKKKKRKKKGKGGERRK